MHWVLIRHAKAEDKTVFALTGRPDAERPLVEAGRNKMRRNVCGLMYALPQLDGVVSSPFVRARQTAEVVADAYGLDVETVDELRPGTEPAALARRLRGRASGCCLALVGHEPDLGRLASWCLDDGRADFAPMKKGGALLMETDGWLMEGGGRLVWALPPSLLRGLGRCAS